MSHTDGTDAYSVDGLFRDWTLKPAHVEFVDFEAVSPAPTSALIAHLAHFPYLPILSEKHDEQNARLLSSANLSTEEIDEVSAAILYARKVPTRTFRGLRYSNESKWQVAVNHIMLEALICDSARDQLQFHANERWNQGLERTATLPEASPDIAVGLAFADVNDDPLDILVLDSLSNASGIRLVYSPSEQDALIYPSVVYKAKSTIPLLHDAENEVAVGATRALALLDELTCLSEVPHQHCVVLLASAGELWKVYVAYQDSDVNKTIVSLAIVVWRIILLTLSQKIVPILPRSLEISYFNDRVQLAYIIHRIKAWLMGPYKAKVCEQLQHLWHMHQANPHQSSLL